MFTYQNEIIWPKPLGNDRLLSYGCGLRKHQTYLLLLYLFSALFYRAAPTVVSKRRRQEHKTPSFGYWWTVNTDCPSLLAVIRFNFKPLLFSFFFFLFKLPLLYSPLFNYGWAIPLQKGTQSYLSFVDRPVFDGLTLFFAASLLVAQATA